MNKFSSSVTPPPFHIWTNCTLSYFDTLTSRAGLKPAGASAIMTRAQPDSVPLWSNSSLRKNLQIEKEWEFERQTVEAVSLLQESVSASQAPKTSHHSTTKICVSRKEEGAQPPTQVQSAPPKVNLLKMCAEHFTCLCLDSGLHHHIIFHSGGCRSQLQHIHPDVRIEQPCNASNLASGIKTPSFCPNPTHFTTCAHWSNTNSPKLDVSVVLLAHRAIPVGSKKSEQQTAVKLWFGSRWFHQQELKRNATQQH